MKLAIQFGVSTYITFKLYKQPGFIFITSSDDWMAIYHLVIDCQCFAFPLNLNEKTCLINVCSIIIWVKTYSLVKGVQRFI